MRDIIKIASYSLIVFFTYTTASAQVDQDQQQEPQSLGIESPDFTVSDKEVEMFSEAFKGIQEESQIGQEKMITAIQEGGFDLERFTEIQQAQLNPTQVTEISKEEQVNLDLLMPVLEKIQAEVVGNMEAKVDGSGLSMVRYQEITNLVQQDVELQQKIMMILQE